MPKYYCDYCDTYLTHDSPSVRRTHTAGRKHKDNVRFYYQKWMETQAQNMIDLTTKAFKVNNGLYPFTPKAPLCTMPPGMPSVNNPFYPGAIPPMPVPPPINMPPGAVPQRPLMPPPPFVVGAGNIMPGVNGSSGIFPPGAQMLVPPPGSLPIPPQSK